MWFIYNSFLFIFFFKIRKFRKKYGRQLLRIKIDPPEKLLGKCIRHLEAVLPTIVVCGFSDIKRVSNYFFLCILFYL
jgi:hypothetical protein